MHPIRIAFRRLALRPAVSVVSILALASGIAATAVAWSLLSTVLLKPLQVREPERLMVAGSTYPTRGGQPGRPSNWFIYPTIDVVRQSGAFAGLAAGGRWSILVEEHGQRQFRTVYFVTANFFDLLGVPPAQGRSFTPEDDRPGAPATVILSDRYWRRMLDATPAVTGHTLQIAGVATTVVGVAPPGFRGLNLAEPPDMYMPLETIRQVGNTSTNFFADTTRRESPTAWLSLIGRLHADGSVDTTTARLNALPVEVRRGASFVLTDINTAAVPEPARGGMRGFGQLLGATVILLLLASGLTVGLLLLIRTEARHDEHAMCLALGASRLHIATGIAAEGALLAVSGAAASVPLTWWLFHALRTYQLPGAVAIENLGLALDPGTMIVTAAGAVAVTMLVALVAASVGLSANVAAALRSRTGGTPRIARRRTRAALVAAQVAVTLVLLAGATLFGKSLIAALRLNPGYDTTRLLSGSVSLFGHGYSREAANDFFAGLRDRLDRSPSIVSAAYVQSQGGMSPAGRLIIDGQPRQFPSLVSYMVVDDRYFRTMGMPILRGRDFNTGDNSSSPLAIIVSESFGRMLADGQDPIGRSYRESSGDVATVVGTVPDIVTNVSVLEPLVIYFAMMQRPPFESRTVVVRARSDGAAAATDVLGAVRASDSRVVPAPLLSMEERIARQMGPQQLGALVLGVLGGIAVLLTILGAYVLSESMAAMRQREVGIRAALGATRSSLSRLLVLETAQLIGIGLAAGLVLAWLGANTIRAFLYQVEPLDVPALTTVSLTVLALTLLVSLRPVLRTTRADLARVLRED